MAPNSAEKKYQNVDIDYDQGCEKDCAITIQNNDYGSPIHNGQAKKKTKVPLNFGQKTVT